LRSNNPVARNAAERMAMNAPVQGTASDMIKVAMVRVHTALRERGLAARMLLQVHDELLFEAPPAEVPAVEALARELMEGAMPLVASASKRSRIPPSLSAFSSGWRSWTPGASRASSCGTLR